MWPRNALQSMHSRQLARGALLIALALALQGLRLVVPLPLPVSTFLIGTLVHMMLTLTLQLNGRSTALLLGFAACDCLFTGTISCASFIACGMAGQYCFCAGLSHIAEQKMAVLTAATAGKGSADAGRSLAGARAAGYGAVKCAQNAVIRYERAPACNRHCWHCAG